MRIMEHFIDNIKCYINHSLLTQGFQFNHSRKPGNKVIQKLGQRSNFYMRNWNTEVRKFELMTILGLYMI